MLPRRAASRLYLYRLVEPMTRVSRAASDPPQSLSDCNHHQVEPDKVPIRKVAVRVRHRSGPCDITVQTSRQGGTSVEDEPYARMVHRWIIGLASAFVEIRVYPSAVPKRAGLCRSSPTANLSIHRRRQRTDGLESVRRLVPLP